MKITEGLLTAAISGTLLGAAGCASTPKQTQAPSAMSAAPDSAMGSGQMQGAKHACKGQNDCKGQGGCKTDKNACKGQNECKGQGGCKTT